MFFFPHLWWFKHVTTPVFVRGRKTATRCPAPELQLCAAGGSGHRTHHLRPREAPRPWQTQRGPQLGQLWQLWRFRDVGNTVAIQGCRILIHEDHGFWVLSTHFNHFQEYLWVPHLHRETSGSGGQDDAQHGEQNKSCWPLKHFWESKGGLQMLQNAADSSKIIQVSCDVVWIGDPCPIARWLNRWLMWLDLLQQRSSRVIDTSLCQ